MSNELGDFLRARRTDSGLVPPTPGTLARRRVSGLRREEVAMAAGISVDYYTRLEQGRETNPSDSVLDALARVLRLQHDAVDHLYALRANSAAVARPRVQHDELLVERMTALPRNASAPTTAYAPTATKCYTSPRSACA